MAEVVFNTKDLIGEIFAAAVSIVINEIYYDLAGMKDGYFEDYLRGMKVELQSDPPKYTTMKNIFMFHSRDYYERPISELYQKYGREMFAGFRIINKACREFFEKMVVRRRPPMLKLSIGTGGIFNNIISSIFGTKKKRPPIRMKDDVDNDNIIDIRLDLDIYDSLITFKDDNDEFDGEVTYKLIYLFTSGRLYLLQISKKYNLYSEKLGFEISILESDIRVGFNMKNAADYKLKQVSFEAYDNNGRSDIHRFEGKKYREVRDNGLDRGLIPVIITKYMRAFTPAEAKDFIDFWDE